jgi:hypothetical protein
VKVQMENMTDLNPTISITGNDCHETEWLCSKVTEYKIKNFKNPLYLSIPAQIVRKWNL